MCLKDWRLWSLWCFNSAFLRKSTYQFPISSQHLLYTFFIGNTCMQTHVELISVKLHPTCTAFILEEWIKQEHLLTYSCTITAQKQLLYSEDSILRPELKKKTRGHSSSLTVNTILHSTIKGVLSYNSKQTKGKIYDTKCTFCIAPYSRLHHVTDFA